MVLLSRDAILAALDLKTEDVPVPEWGGAVRVKGLTGAERLDYEQACLRTRGNGDVQPDPRNYQEKLVVRAVVGENGERLFSDQDVRLLADKSGAALNRVFQVASRLAGLSQEDVAELEGNSEAAIQSGDSSSS